MGLLKRLFGNSPSSESNIPKEPARDCQREATASIATGPETSPPPAPTGTPPPVVVNRINEIPWNDWNVPANPERLMVVENVKVVGVTHNNQDGVSRQEILARMKRWEVVDIIREPNNAYDKNAIGVISGMGQIGHLPASTAADIAPLMDRGAGVLAKLSGLYGGKEGKSWGGTVDMHITLPDDVISYTMKVVGITGKDEYGNSRKETAEGVFEGDVVELHEDEDDDWNPIVRVCADYFNELGRLNKSDAKKIHPLLSEGRKIDARISSVEEEEKEDSEDTKLTVFVTIIVF